MTRNTAPSFAPFWISVQLYFTMLILLKVARIKQVMKGITISLLCCVNPTEIELLIFRIFRSKWPKRVTDQVPWFSLINIQWAQHSFKLFSLSLRVQKIYKYSAYAVCQKHETRKVWQILVKVSIVWDHTDIQDGGLEMSYCLFLCLHAEVPMKVKRPKPRGFSCFSHVFVR